MQTTMFRPKLARCWMHPAGPDNDATLYGIELVDEQQNCVNVHCESLDQIEALAASLLVQVHQQRKLLVKEAAQAVREALAAAPTQEAAERLLTLQEALRNPEAFVAGMTETGGTYYSPELAKLQDEASARPRAMAAKDGDGEADPTYTE